MNIFKTNITSKKHHFTFLGSTHFDMRYPVSNISSFPLFFLCSKGYLVTLCFLFSFRSSGILLIDPWVLIYFILYKVREDSPNDAGSLRCAEACSLASSAYGKILTVVEDNMYSFPNIWPIGLIRHINQVFIIICSSYQLQNQLKISNSIVDYFFIYNVLSFFSWFLRFWS